MATKKRARSTPTPLIVEKHPESYTGYSFITLIQHLNSHLLTIVDNSDDQTIKAYVLDCSGPEGVDDNLIMEVASDWYANARDRYPISIEFSKRGLAEMAGKIYRTYNIEFVTRVIGPLPHYEMIAVESIKRRRRKPIPLNIEIKFKHV